MTTDTPKRYMTVVYEITDETEWRKTNPLSYAHNGLNAVRVCVDDACELLDEAESEARELNILMIGWKQRATMSETDLEASNAEVERLRKALQSCYWATNTYDGNYTRACDNVATIAIAALKTQDK